MPSLPWTPSAEADEIAFAAVGAAIAVHRELVELEHRRIPFETQVPSTVRYRGVDIGDARIDMIVGGLVIVELEVVERLHAQHTIQTLSYLTATGLPLGLLMNFHIAILTKGVRRVLPLRAP